MHERIKQLAEYSGFVFWDDKLDTCDIDWSSEYDEAFAKYTEHLIRDVVDMQKSGTNVLKFFGLKKTKMSHIDLDFKDKDIELALHRLAREQGITIDKVVEHALCDLIVRQNREHSDDATSRSE